MITVSQCDLNHEQVYQHIMWLTRSAPRGAPPQRLIVCSEDHDRTEGRHLHLFVEFPRRVDVKDAQRWYSAWFGWDEVRERPFMPSFKLPRTGVRDRETFDTPVDMIRYVIKHGNWVANFDVLNFLSPGDPALPQAKRSKVWPQILDRLKAGESTTKLLYDEELGPTVARELQKIQVAASVISMKIEADQRNHWPSDLMHPLFQGFMALLGPNGPWSHDRTDYECAETTIRWIVRNLQPRQAGQTQLIVGGPTSNQKSSLVEALGKWVTVGWWNVATNRNDTAYQRLTDDTELLAVDEYERDTIPGVEVLKILSDASQTQFRRFHQEGMRPAFPLPVIMLTNNDNLSNLIPEAFTAQQADAYRRRVEFAHIPGYGRRDFFLPVVQWLDYAGRSYNRVRASPKAVPFPIVCPPCCTHIVLPPALGEATSAPSVFDLPRQVIF